MSWHVELIGTKEEVVKGLEESNYVSDTSDSGASYKKALPHLVGLVKLVVEDRTKKTVKIKAYGHGSFDGKKLVDGNVGVELAVVYEDFGNND